MTNEQQQVRDWMKGFKQECPEKPTIPSLEVRILRAKLIWEEAVKELIGEGLGLSVKIYAESKEGEVMVLANSKFLIDVRFVENVEGPNLVKIADGCEDLKVVTEGTLVACGLLKHEKGQMSVGVITPGLPARISYQVERKEDPLFNEVIRSNNSKFWTEEEYREHVDKNINNPDWIPSTVLDEYDPTKIKHIIIKDRNGKVVKPPSYNPPNLQPIIDEMGE